MPTTLKKLNESRINIISKLLKKDEDFSPISPELIKDLRDKTLLENPSLKLSINDYKLMCSNKTVLNMMSISLNKPKAKLKKFCKYISVFEENRTLVYRTFLKVDLTKAARIVESWLQRPLLHQI